MANEQYLIEGVKALYPRINKPYRYDTKLGKTAPCGQFDDNARYSTSFLMDEDEAKALYNKMDAAYTARRKASWPKELDAPAEVFKETEGGEYEYKTHIPCAFNKVGVDVPQQFDSQANLLKDDFELTGGSTVNLVVELIPYMRKDGKDTHHGVSLRLRQVQVIKLAERKAQASSLLGKVEGGFVAGEQPATPTFGSVADNMPDVEEEVLEVEEPKKVVSIKKEPAAAPATEKDLSGLVNKWGSKKKAD